MPQRQADAPPSPLPAASAAASARTRESQEGGTPESAQGSDLQLPVPKLQNLLGASGWCSAPPSPADQKLETQVLRWSTGFPGTLQERAQWIVERGRGLGQGLPGCRQRNPQLGPGQPSSRRLLLHPPSSRSGRSLIHRPAFPYLRGLLEDADKMRKLGAPGAKAWEG